MTKSSESLRVIVLKKNFYTKVLEDGVKEAEEQLKAQEKEIEAIASRLQRMSLFTNPLGYARESSKLRQTTISYHQQYKKVTEEEIPHAENKVKEYKQKIEQALWLGTV